MLPPKKITLLPKITDLLPILQIAKNKAGRVALENYANDKEMALNRKILKM
jgi:hypothetical protein